jgi:hypothetical protein
VLSTVGFQGLANLGNRAINGVETFATSQQWNSHNETESTYT